MHAGLVSSPYYIVLQTHTRKGILLDPRLDGLTESNAATSIKAKGKKRPEIPSILLQPDSQ